MLQRRTKEHCNAVLEEVKSLGIDIIPNAPESSLPGVIVGAFIDDRRSGRNFSAGNFYGLTLEAAVKKAENKIPIYTGSVAYIRE